MESFYQGNAAKKPTKTRGKRGGYLIIRQWEAFWSWRLWGKPIYWSDKNRMHYVKDYEEPKIQSVDEASIENAERVFRQRPEIIGYYSHDIHLLIR